jgi:hypothetical protein
MINKSQENASNQHAASAEILGEAFHNPYTFIPFPSRVDRIAPPTPLTIDDDPEQIDFRISGVLELQVKTLSPLMTCSPEPVDPAAEHKHYRALSIGSDVILPASGVRGALRKLMTIISGGALGYLDEHLWLPRTNNVRLGPSEKDHDVPSQVFLARVERAGSSTRPGLIELGETRLMNVDDINAKLVKSGKLKGRELDDYRPTNQRKQVLELDGWQIKLSGRPVNRKGKKKEGLFRGNGIMLELAEHFWADYQGKHRHAVISELKKDDLVWLEPSDVGLSSISSQQDIRSLQWSRWGRGGIKLMHALPTKQLMPDNLLNHDKVDWVTDLFGHIPKPGKSKSPAAFAARIRPGNLVFFDALNNVSSETLAPLAAPHPGCLAFYNDVENLDEVDANGVLRGYKVYRNTRERGAQAPWKFSTQGIYDETGRLLANDQQKMNKTVELLDEGLSGRLRISFRALDAYDLALLYAACAVDWKLGGGKPLGLGHCRVTRATLLTEDGERYDPLPPCEEGLSLDGENLELLNARIDDFEQRYALYQTSQIAVEKLRYPRAVERNNNRNSRAGLSWFNRHANQKKSGKGLETVWTAGELRQASGKSQLRAQPLPKLVANKPNADVLYGYDMINSKSTTEKQRKLIEKLEPFEERKHISGQERSGENTSQNADTRRGRRLQRKDD